ncbi:MAG TPA: hypothetical protein VJI98_01160 [Candidatus Nanoarchaeia archaeon]|nr:hypothetical protein [Candidatus Nanoarchaeia archaeon]
MALSKLGQLERKIARLSRRSKIAPPEFLESELKRFAAIERLKRILIEEINPESMVRILEQEFKIYFEPRKTRIRLIDDWKYVYAGSNAQIELFLCDNDFQIATTKMGFGHYREMVLVIESDHIRKASPKSLPEGVQKKLLEGQNGYVYVSSNGRIKPFNDQKHFQAAISKGGVGYCLDKAFVGRYRWIGEVSQEDLPERVKNYFIGIGYLYPNEDGTLTIHGNARRGQRSATLINPSGNAFLSRDRIRIPYYETHYGRIEKSTFTMEGSLTERELWKFWGDLLAMEVSGEGYYYYTKTNFRRREQGLAVRRKLQETLDFGHCLVPQRYICKEPKIEEWGWNEDCLGKYLPRVIEQLNLKPRQL